MFVFTFTKRGKKQHFSECSFHKSQFQQPYYKSNRDANDIRETLLSKVLF